MYAKNFTHPWNVRGAMNCATTNGHFVKGYVLLYKWYNGLAHAQYQFAHFEKDQNNMEIAAELFQAAIKDWRVGIELQPEGLFKNSKLSEIYRNIGISKIELADIETQRNEASKAVVLYSSTIDDLTDAIQLNPKNTYAYSNRAWVYYLLGKHELEIWKHRRITETI